MKDIKQLSARFRSPVTVPDVIEVKGNAVTLKNSGNTIAIVGKSLVLYPGESIQFGLQTDENMIFQRIPIDFVGLSFPSGAFVGPQPSSPMYRVDVVEMQVDDCTTSDFVPK